MLITEVKVIGGRVIKVYRTLDESETEDTGVEIEIPLGVTRNSGDVMDASGAEAH